MSMLLNVKKGKIIRPVLMLIYGPGGIGKSTWGAKAPNPIYLGAEDGTDHLDVSRFPSPRNFEDIILAIDELTKEQHAYQSLVIDSLDWIEPMIHDAICRREGVKSIEKAAGGYGKGYIEAYNYWLSLKDKLTKLRDERQMNIILLAHPEVVTTTNPQTQVSFQRYELKLHKRPKAMFMEYVDAMFFASYAMYTKREGEVVKAVTSTLRVLYGNWQDGFDAKNRYGLVEPIPLTITWDEFVTLCNVKPGVILPSLDEASFMVESLAAQVKDDNIKAKVIETIQKAGGDVAQLVKIIERLKALNAKE